MKKIKYRKDNRIFVLLTNGKKRNIKNLQIGDEYVDCGITRMVVDREKYIDMKFKSGWL